MKALGVDFGDAKIGLAVSGGSLAMPLTVFRYKSIDDALNNVLNIIQQENVQRVVVGISENKSAQNAQEFARKLQDVSSTQVFLEDETLTTQDANRLAQEAGIKRKKRKAMEDAYAATLILQKHLDNIQQPI